MPVDMGLQSCMLAHVCVSIWCILVHSSDVCEFPPYAVLGTMKRKSPCPCTSSGGQKINNMSEAGQRRGEKQNGGPGSVEGGDFLSLSHVL